MRRVQGLFRAPDLTGGLPHSDEVTLHVVDYGVQHLHRILSLGNCDIACIHQQISTSSTQLLWFYVRDVGIRMLRVEVGRQVEGIFYKQGRYIVTALNSVTSLCCARNML